MVQYGQRVSSMDRGFYTIEEAAVFFGRRVNTILAWLRDGKIEGALWLIHGGRVQRVIKTEEVDRVFSLEVPDIDLYPDSLHQRLWNRRRAPGVKGAAVRAKQRAERAKDKGSKE